MAEVVFVKNKQIVGCIDTNTYDLTDPNTVTLLMRDIYRQLIKVVERNYKCKSPALIVSDD